MFSAIAKKDLRHGAEHTGFSGVRVDSNAAAALASVSFTVISGM
jgi:hypothetical protein